MARMGKLGWFFGLIFGTVFGVLFAPRRGKDLRDRVKTDIKKGKLGIAPLKDDMRHLGEEVAAMAMDFYHSAAVQDVVEAGRERIRELSKEFVEEVNDFHVTKIDPHLRDIQERAESLKKKVTVSTKIGKKAVQDIKKEIKKKGSRA